MPDRKVRDLFNLSGQVAVITGGAGLLGVRHAQAIAEMGGIPVLVDIDAERAEAQAANVAQEFSVPATAFTADLTRPEAVADLHHRVMERFGRVDILINNAARNPK